jgi:hypothetical protein
MAVNSWKVATNGLINQSYLLCGIGEESIMHKFWDCKILGM